MTGADAPVGSAEWLRDELLAAAAAAVPGQDGVVASETASGTDYGDGGPEGPASCMVEAGDPRTDAGVADQIDRIAETFRLRGWSVTVDADGPQHRAVATIAGASAIAHGWDGHWKLTLLGQAAPPA